MAILVTRRLRLRRLTLDDLDDLHAVLSDPVAMAHYPTPFGRDMTRGWIEWNLRSYAEHGFGLWAVVHAADARLIGDCGLTIQQVDGVAELEIGYHVLPAYWGRGLATEAAIACRDLAFDRLGRSRVISKMREDNAASRRVAEKVGMRPEKTTQDDAGTTSIVYAMSPADRREDRATEPPRGALAVRRVEDLPGDLERLVDAGLDEGFGFVARLRDDWRAGGNRFDGPGEALFEARIEDELVGVCGLNRDPFATETGVGRVRRLYVRPQFRRLGVGRRLVESVLTIATGEFEKVRLRTDSESASRFYGSLGFTRTHGDPDATHERILTGRVPESR